MTSNSSPAAQATELTVLALNAIGHTFSPEGITALRLQASLNGWNWIANQMGNTYTTAELRRAFFRTMDDMQRMFAPRDQSEAQTERAALLARVCDLEDWLLAADKRERAAQQLRKGA